MGLSDGVLSMAKNGGYIALKIGTGPNSDAVTVREGRVSFFIRSTGTLNRARAEGFAPALVDASGLSNKDKYRFPGLRLSDIDGHEALFREIVRDSISTILDRRPKGK
jgi:hypothetical protein